MAEGQVAQSNPINMEGYFKVKVSNIKDAGKGLFASQELREGMTFVPKSEFTGKINDVIKPADLYHFDAETIFKSWEEYEQSSLAGANCRLAWQGDATVLVTTKTVKTDEELLRYYGVDWLIWLYALYYCGASDPIRTQQEQLHYKNRYPRIAAHFKYMVRQSRPAWQDKPSVQAAVTACSAGYPQLQEVLSAVFNVYDVSS